MQEGAIGRKVAMASSTALVFDGFNLVCEAVLAVLRYSR